MTVTYEARRTNNGVTLQQISHETKISTRILQAIENGEFGKLPGGIYSTAYIRQYAQLAKIDEHEILEAYEQHLALVEGKHAVEPERPSALRRWSTVVMGS